MNILISGGAKNGKSMFAQRTAKVIAEEQGVPFYYVATMIPVDEEDEDRIRRHRRERAGWGFTTLERGRDLTGLLTAQEEARSPSQVGRDGVPVESRGVFLLDSVTALLGNEMFLPDGRVDRQAPDRVACDCIRFAEMTGNAIFVSDGIYGGAESYESDVGGVRGAGDEEIRSAEPDNLTEAYRRGLALIDRRLAQVCMRVVEVSAGCIEEWKTSKGEQTES